jgi:hypothetical protein
LFVVHYGHNAIIIVIAAIIVIVADVAGPSTTDPDLSSHGRCVRREMDGE